MQTVPMTVEGHARLQKELQQLKTVDRPEIIEAIAEARAHGDLKENAEYHAAKERQGFIEGRIAMIEGKLSFAQVIDLSQVENQGRVVFGSKVTLLNLETDEQVMYHIVGEDEADLTQRKISISSPMVRAIIGKEVDQEVVVTTPSGEVEYLIESVDYGK